MKQLTGDKGNLSCVLHSGTVIGRLQGAFVYKAPPSPTDFHPLKQIYREGAPQCEAHQSWCPKSKMKTNEHNVNKKERDVMQKVKIYSGVAETRV